MARKKIRICYVLSRFDIGGAETVALDLARKHDPSNFEVEVVAFLEPRRLEESEMHRRFREAGVKTVMIYQNSYRSPLSLWRIYRYLRKGRFDIILGHNRGADYWAVKIGRWAGIPHRYWTRHLVYVDMSKKQIQLYSKISSSTHKVFAVSETVRKACTEIEQIPATKIETIVNGIDMDKYAPIAGNLRNIKRNELAVPTNDALLLFVGRFNQQKAPESFIRLVWKLRARGVAVRGYMCGYGPLEDQLHELNSDGPDGVDILGLRSDVPELLASCDLFVSTSRNEGLPLNVMEAMASGAAIVAPDIPQVRELVSGVSILEDQLYDAPPITGEVPELLVDKWAELVEEVLANKDRRQAVGAAGRQAIGHRFSLEQMVDRYEDSFLKACR